MDSALYIAANGADQIMMAMQANNNNLANANTTGFKADIEVFKSLPVTGENLNTRVYTERGENSANFKPGPLIQTGRDLDVAIPDKGWFAVETAEQGEAYTRRGDFKISPEGLLTTSNNLPVIGNGGPISIPPSSKIEIAGDGTISVIPIGQDADTIVTIDRLKLVSPKESELKKGIDGLFYYHGQDDITVDNQIKVVSQSLEGSNVSSVEALVMMMDLTRQYEMQMKLVKSLESNDSQSAQIMQIE